MRFGDTIICEWAKDGGPESKVDGFWMFRSKRWGTVAVLKFAQGSREAFHSHAFNSHSIVLKGKLLELHKNGEVDVHSTGHYIRTLRNTFHKVLGLEETSWVLTVRGPWSDTWLDQDEKDGITRTLTHNRVEVL